MSSVLQRYRRKIILTGILLAIVLAFIRLTVNTVFFDSWTYLNVACKTGCFPCAWFFLAMGADPNQQVETHVYVIPIPLVLAAQSDSPNIIRQLVTHGGNVNKTNYPGEMTPLLWAAMENHKDAVQALLKAGADPNVSGSIGDYSRWTALHWAITNHNLQMAQLLLSNKANPNKPWEVNAETPLHIAVEVNEPAILRVLLDVGADAHIKNEQHFTPYALARMKNYPEIISIFESKGIHQ